MDDEVSYWQWALGKRVSRRRALRGGVAAGLGMAALSVWGCSQQQQQQQRTEVPSSGAKVKYGGTLRVILTQEPPHFDPHQNASAYGAYVLGKVYSRLVRYRAGREYEPGDMTIIPDLAEKWEMPDDVTYVFNLRKGAKFHDIPPVNGREVDATDVKYSFDRLRNPDTKSPVISSYAPISSVEAPEKYTAKFVTKEPYAPFIPFLAHSYAPYVIPKEAVEKFGDLKKNAIGTGPFMLDTYERDVKLILKKNPQYFVQGLPYLDQINVLRITDPSTAKAAYLSGEVDIWSTTVEDIDETKKALPDSVFDKALSSVTMALVMVWKPPFSDARVRQAIILCADVQRMIDTVYKGDAVFGSIVTPLFADWCLKQDELKKLYKVDVAKAKQLMAEAGFPNGFKSTVYSTPPHGQAVKDMSLMLAQDVKQIGIQLDYESVEYNTHLKKWADHNFDIYSGGIVPGPEMDEYTYGQFHPKGSRNFALVNDDKLTAMCEKQRLQVKEAERKQTVLDIQRRAAEIAAQIPEPMVYNYTASRGYVKGWSRHFDLGGTHYMNIWLDK